MCSKGPTTTEEFHYQRTLLLSAIGGKGSGYERYSAAMYFHKGGIVSPDLLEIYRRCCKLDNEDPIKLAIHEGIKVFQESDLKELEQEKS